MKNVSLSLLVVLLAVMQACAGTGWFQSTDSNREKPSVYRVRGEASVEPTALSDHQTRALSRHLAVQDAELKLRARLMEERFSSGKKLGEVAEDDTALRARVDALVKRATRVEVNWKSPREAEVLLELRQNDIDQILHSYRVVADVSDTS